VIAKRASQKGQRKLVFPTATVNRKNRPKICFTADDTCVYGRFLHLVSLSSLKHHPPNSLRMA
jgi:hypothetical protein